MTRIRSVRLASLAGLTAAALALTACAGTTASGPASSSAAAGTASASAPALETLTPGKLTIATGEPAYEPWVVGDAPENGEGFEAAVAYAVAEQLGYAQGDVVWTRSTFDAAIAPGPKDFDLNIQQFSITDERKRAVDFSSPYYTTNQAIVTTDGSDAAGITSAAGLKDVTIGVATGTTTFDIVSAAIGEDPQVFNSNDDAVLALKSGQVDAIAVDLPTAFYLAAAEIENGVVLGQFEGTEGGDEFGVVLAKDSPLTAPVTEAVDALREDGTLDALTEQWLSTAVDVPVFS